MLTFFCNAQYNPLGEDKTFVALDRENGFFMMSSIAIASYFLSKKNANNLKTDYFQSNFGYFNGERYQIYIQNFGVEREYASWFALRMEANIQEIITENNFYTLGIGYKLFSRWILLKRQRLRPYFEYGAGAFFAIKEFPKKGTSFTFNLTYALGLEYQLKNKNKMSLDYGFKHHSNASLSDNNPGFNGNGIRFSYSWFLK